MGRGFFVMAGSSPGRCAAALRGAPPDGLAVSGRDGAGAGAEGDGGVFSLRPFGRFPPDTDGGEAVSAVFFRTVPGTFCTRPVPRLLFSSFESGYLAACLCGPGRTAFRASAFGPCPGRLFCRGGRSGLGGISNTCMG